MVYVLNEIFLMGNLQNLLFDNINVCKMSQEFAPTDDELSAYRRGEEWDAERAKQEAKMKVIIAPPPPPPQRKR